MTNVLTAALRYALLGWRVIPLHNLTTEGKCTCQEWRDEQGIGLCGTPGKHPRFKGFVEAATTDESQIRRWWTAWPQANVGLITGAQSKIFALDVDPRNGGDASFEALIHKVGPWPWTTAARTGGGGSHYYFKWPEGLDIPAMLELDDGLEVIGEGHVLVAAPSRHPSGRPYEWEPELGPDEQLPVDAPAVLLDLIRAKLQPPPKPTAGDGKYKPADVGPILLGCAWMAHCSDAAATLVEPQWYAQLSILGRCVNGEELAHELSSPHHGYTRATTDAKLSRALTDCGPVRCTRVRSSLGGESYCSKCEHWGKIKSPIVLGMERREQIPFPEDPPPDFKRFAEKEETQPQDPEKPPEPEKPKIVSISKAEEAVNAAIAADDVEAALNLAPLLAAESVTLQGVLMARLEKHFGKRLRMRNLDRAIKAEKTARKFVVVTGPQDWRSRLIRYQNGEPKPHLANAIIALRFAPEWREVLWRNEFAECTIARKKPPIDAPEGEWTPRHDIVTNEWLQHQGIDAARQIAGTAVEAVAYDRTFHPVREYLLAVKWDGVPRLDDWLTRYLGAKPPAELARDAAVTVTPPKDYLESVGAKWMIAAVARVIRPGCKADDVLILEGEQGIKKSSALAVLGGEWFTDQIEQLGTKDSSMQINGVWIIEIGELGAMTRAERETVKAFMSRQKERYRPPYADRLVKVPRQCVFAGTVNPDVYLRDETGARRFWPVSCGVIDLAALKRDRDQLWAEAKFRYDEGATWWLDVAEVIQVAEREQADRYVEDPWDGPIWRYMQFEDEVTIDKIFKDCLNIEMGRRTQADRNRVGAVLRARGWKRFRVSVGDRSYVYRPYTQAARFSGAKQAPLVEERL